MADAFSQETITRLAAQLREPAWITQLRKTAFERHQSLAWPHVSDDIWRRTDITLLDPTKAFHFSEPGLLHAIPLSDAQLAALTRPLADERFFVRADGQWLKEDRLDKVHVETLAEAAQHVPEQLKGILEADGLTVSEQKLVSLNEAFHHDDLVIRVEPGFAEASPIRIIRSLSAKEKQALFCLRY